MIDDTDEGQARSVIPQTIARRMLLAVAATGGALSLLPTARADEEEKDGEEEDDEKEEKYGLDGISRRVPRRGRLKCPDVELEIYRGEHIRYAQAAKVYVGFVKRLAKMEKVARAAAIDVYGRPPSRLVHMGTYSCRRIRAYPTWISEHALGNAIDIEGFNFPALKRGEKLPAGVPRALRHAFAVRLKRHWKAKRGPTKLHAEFLRSFATRLIARNDIFRVLLGPAYPGHHNHFHLDCAPWRIVDVFEEDED